MSAPGGDWIATGPRKPGAPLLITAELPPDVLGWTDALRREHYPPERNRLRAHVTLFHALPPSVEAELLQVLSDLARCPAPPARITGLMKLDRGTALAVESPEMVMLHHAIAERMHGLLTDQDTRPLRLHVTIQNKVPREAARALQASLAPDLRPVSFRFRGFGLYAWEEGLWRPIRTIAFRG
ncbi:2'-5' RNA ligase family protein [Novosphingobium mangrovi (ex Huang et al. 2023)]|uniref:2'-5' RNA ligase family protein n=1 Tax=Novosphingobium mangrovi (ex Huang et al. 2023) TaxID=2976432 RepID=A0ABT2I6W7_9SPHN|nr:2'-5' RNA ligase family protein [Novosphingobium mangrovi (ex Huang et al. 2023)]MCT2400550.1 2'-5' RNA ligase family protein [Novosphingobium mangrovi (ex Huang et al. 2023)]